MRQLLNEQHDITIIMWIMGTECSELMGNSIQKNYICDKIEVAAVTNYEDIETNALSVQVGSTWT